MWTVEHREEGNHPAVGIVLVGKKNFHKIAMLDS